MLQSFFPRRLIHIDPACDPKDSTHPVLAVLNEYANSHAIAIAKTLDAPPLTVGDSVHRKIKGAHNCLLINDKREALRIASNCQRADILDAEFRNHVVRGTKTVQCIDGAQNCCFRAKTAFAVHSLYDVDHHTLARIFAQHDLEEMYVYMYFPLAFHDRHLAPMDNLCFSVHQDKQQLIFTMRDSAIPYIHNHATWKTWLEFTCIEAENFCLVRETVAVHGPLHIIRINRIAQYPGKIYRNSPLGALAGDVALVPSFGDALKFHFAAKQSELRHHLVPNHVLNVLLSYASRQHDEAYKFTELATVAGGLLRALKIGNVIYADKWNIRPSEFNDAVVSIFMIGALKRTDRTQTISEAFKHLKAYAQHDGIAYELRTLFYRFVNWVAPPGARNDSRRLWEYDIKYLDDSPSTLHLRASAFVAPHVDVDVPIEPVCAPPQPICRYPKELLNYIPCFNFINGSSAHSPSHIAPLCSPAERPRTYSTAMRPNTVRSPSADNLSPDNVLDTCRLADLAVERADVRSITSRHDSIASLASMYPEWTTAQLMLRPPSANSVLSREYFIPPSAINADRDDDLPTPAAFLPGHCLIESFWHTYYPKHMRIKQASYIKALYAAGLKHLLDCHECTRTMVNGYFRQGAWDCLFTEHLIPIMANHFDCTITIQTATTPIVIGSGKKNVVLVHEGDHFSLPRGGLALTKFSTLADKLSVKGQSVFEVSAAPGTFASITAPICEFTFGHYTPGLRVDAMHTLGPTSKNGHPNTIIVAGVNCSYFAYDSAQRLSLYKHNHDVVLCDAAANAYSETLINKLAPICHRFVKPGGTLAIKTFMNMKVVCDLAADYSTIEVWRNPDLALGSNERYYILRDRQTTRTTNDTAMVFKAFSQRETEHVIRFKVAEANRFLLSFFSDFTGKQPVLLHDTDHNFTVKAVTGYASASKTTYAVKQYPHAVMIAPTNKLSLTHHKLGMSSYTQHVALMLKTAPDTILIDEISQLPVEYIMLVHAVYPNADIIILGDIYQVPYINFADDQCYTHVSSIGVENNSNVVYQIPKDICTMLNRKFRFNIITESPVARSICKVDKLEKVKHLPVICFNDLTQRDLAKRGYDAHTITCYEGSREDCVVLYIDGKAITSKFINRSEWVYTAVTRHRKVLVLAGDVDYLANYFEIRGHNLEAFENFAETYVASDQKLTQCQEAPLGTDHDDDVKLYTDQMRSESPPLAAVATTLNAAHSRFHDDSVPYVLHNTPSVASGTLTVDPLVIQAAPPVVHGYRLADNVPATVQQSSADPVFTVRTLVKRYAAKTPRVHGKQIKVTLNQLQRGFAKAVYGSADLVRRFESDLVCSREELSCAYAEYLSSLQDKLNSNPSIADEIEKDFNWYDETLDFIAKNQLKYSPKDFAELTDKAGQGIAAMSKRVNLMLCAWARLMNHKINELCRKIGSKCHFATFGSDEQNLDRLNSLLRDPRSSKCVFVDNDYTEWDVHFLNILQRFSGWLLQCMGCPSPLVTTFLQFRSHWKMFYSGKRGKANLQGHYKQFSGNPFTLIENTLANCALTNSLYDFVQLSFMFYKGDDSTHRCKEAVLTTEGELLLNVTKHKLKLSRSVIGEFASFIMTADTAGPDLFRRTTKFVGSLYRDAGHFHDAKVAAASTANLIKSEAQLREIALATALHYGHKITPEEVVTMHSFLRNTAPNLKATDLKRSVGSSLQL